MKKFNIIVAMEPSTRGIGFNGVIPWKSKHTIFYKSATYQIEENGIEVIFKIFKRE